MQDSVVAGNVATDHGGAFNFESADLAVLVNVTIAGNVAAARGGGGWCQSETPVQLFGCSVANNTAASGGGFFAAAPCRCAVRLSWLLACVLRCCIAWWLLMLRRKLSQNSCSCCGPLTPSCRRLTGALPHPSFPGLRCRGASSATTVPAGKVAESPSPTARRWTPASRGLPTTALPPARPVDPGWECCGAAAAPPRALLLSSHLVACLLDCC